MASGYGAIGVELVDERFAHTMRAISHMHTCEIDV